MAEQNSRKRARVDGTPPPAGLYPDHQGRPGIPNDASSELLGPPPAYSPAPDYRSTAPSTPLVRPFHRTEPSQASAAGSPTGLQDHGYQNPIEAYSRRPPENSPPDHHRPRSSHQDAQIPRRLRPHQSPVIPPQQQSAPPSGPQERPAPSLDDNNVGCSRMERSTGCINSSRLTNCTGCVNSSRLDDCTDCVNSSRCTNSTDLVDCSRCNDCRSCVGCSNCSGLVDEIGVRNKHA
ncbi:hypothetical protein CC77DRAFT_1100449 [Alternaria alternata]|uniref:Uncharacterized protein n=1 Tax=Alternaria alternata TaxID=5599 RepID=A0A177D2R8_ALTAL|nr:hypothetical protein CC77DRAFT_1100449 [Alternaria alternata]OAG13904.1 hypothetical protein CC77DRAFT_1100449 [Alternaria alternata]